MTAENRCPACDAELAANAPRGLCPACLLKGGLGTQTGDGRPAAGNFVPPTPAELTPFFPELEILELVGRGGMGVVYKARQRRLDRLVALKILSPEIGQDRAFAERFTREARALGMLNHPHIVAVYDFGQSSLPSPVIPAAGEGLYYFLMEFVDGLNVRQLLNTGKLAPKEALAIVPQICEALQYAHDHGVVHRDIKPENVLLDKEGRVKIADFGIAKLVGSEAPDLTLTGAGQIVGTPQYMAPEQIEHPMDVDHRADIYSLGVVFYQMLTGELPIGRFAPPSRKVQIDVRLDEVVLRALEKEPDLRYQQASEVKSHVESIVTTPSQQGASGSTSAPLTSIPRPPQFADLVGMLGGVAFTSSLARAIANASALGFLGFLACLGFVPLPGMQRCFGFSGLFGLFGLTGVAFMVEFAHVRKAKQAAGTLRESALNREAQEQARLQLHGPAVGLVVTSVLNWLSIFVLLITLMPFAAHEGVSPDVFFLVATVLAVGSAVILVGALRMQRLESLVLARLAGIAAMLIGPGYIIGWPVGIWSLVVLARPEVVAAFRNRQRELRQKGVPAWVKKTLWSVLVVVGVALVVRTFVFENFLAPTDAVAPEVPQGSRVVVFKLARTYSRGDIAVYRNNGVTMIGRVIEAGPKDGILMVQRRHESPRQIAAADLVGKVILNTRAERSGDGGTADLEIQSKGTLEPVDRKDVVPDDATAADDTAAAKAKPIPAAQVDPLKSPRAEAMRTIVLAALEYATEHPDWPKTLDELKPKYLDGGKIDLGQFVYYPLSRESLEKDPQDVVVLSEKEPAFAGGRIVGFADGYVEFIRNAEHSSRPH